MCLYLLGKVVKSLIEQILEENKLFHDFFIGLLEIAGLESYRQLTHKLLILLIVEHLLEIGRLLDVVVDLKIELLRNVVLVV